ncbi:hypothetical protein Dimus_030192, partial [Dionaea muscipula]
MSTASAARRHQRSSPLRMLAEADEAARARRSPAALPPPLTKPPLAIHPTTDGTTAADRVHCSPASGARQGDGCRSSFGFGRRIGEEFPGRSTARHHSTAHRP